MVCGAWYVVCGVVREPMPRRVSIELDVRNGVVSVLCPQSAERLLCASPARVCFPRLAAQEEDARDPSGQVVGIERTVDEDLVVGPIPEVPFRICNRLFRPSLPH